MKKILAALLAMALLCCLTGPAFAAEGEAEDKGEWVPWYDEPDSYLQQDEAILKTADGAYLLKYCEAGEYWNDSYGRVKVPESGWFIAESAFLYGDITLPTVGPDGRPIIGLYAANGPGTGAERVCLTNLEHVTSIRIPEQIRYLRAEEIHVYIGGQKLKKVYGLSHLELLDEQVVYWAPEFFPFEDAYDKWYEEAARWAYQNRVVSGISLTEFAPEKKLSRGMAVTMLHRMAGKPQAEKHPFTDVEKKDYYYDAVGWGAENGIVKGMAEGVFAAGPSVTRQDLACMLYRYASLSGEPEEEGDLSRFSDSGSVSGYARDAVRWAVGKGLLTGRPDGTLDPRGTATRAEAAAVFQRYANTLEEPLEEKE